MEIGDKHYRRKKRASTKRKKSGNVEVKIKSSRKRKPFSKTSGKK